MGLILFFYREVNMVKIKPYPACFGSNRYLRRCLRYILQGEWRFGPLGDVSTSSKRPPKVREVPFFF